ncbi:hypothetical protein FRB94_002741 [Tulasnella sp. JGI-2019a]|nr:hypothetical protein FRB94_002741 [Tulasnella sp. JGI-2019a]KAG9013325.1 hypothetical protein FRB93_000848 [Tulasnella sp. JGI-2019a]
MTSLATSQDLSHVETTGQIEGWAAGPSVAPSGIIATCSCSPNTTDHVQIVLAKPTPNPMQKTTSSTAALHPNDPKTQAALVALARRLVEANIPASLFQADTPSAVYVTLDAETLERHLLSA